MTFTIEQNTTRLATLCALHTLAGLASSGSLSPGFVTRAFPRVENGKKYVTLTRELGCGLMVVKATGVIHGTKAYRKIHPGRTYGTFATVLDDWWWGDYYPSTRAEALHYRTTDWEVNRDDLVFIRHPQTGQPIRTFYFLVMPHGEECRVMFYRCREPGVPDLSRDDFMQTANLSTDILWRFAVPMEGMLKASLAA